LPKYISKVSINVLFDSWDLKSLTSFFSLKTSFPVKDRLTFKQQNKQAGAPLVGFQLFGGCGIFPVMMDIHFLVELIYYFCSKPV
jgi:hypothetical protein